MEERKFTMEVGPYSFFLKISGTSYGSLFISVEPKATNKLSTENSDYFSFSPHMVVEAAKKALSGAEFNSYQELVDVLGSKIEGESNVASVHHDLGQYFGWDTPSIFAEGQGVPNGKEKKGDIEESLFVLTHKGSSENTESLIVRITTRKLPKSASIEGGGKVNGDNINFREILYIGYELVDNEKWMELYDIQVRNQAEVRRLNIDKLTLANDQETMNYVKTNLIDTIYAGNKSNQVTRRNAYSDVGQALKSNRESANQMNKDQEMNFIELSSLGGLRSRELEYDNRDAMKQIMRVLANAIGEQRASEFSIYALIDTAFMKNSPIPELDFSQGEDVSKQILEHTTNGFYVTKAESGVSISKRRYIFIHDQTHPGLVYKVNVSDSGRGDYETIFSTYLIPKEVIQDYVQETTQNDKERKFNREIGRFGREQSGVLELNGQKYDNITVNDESITIQNPDRSLLINGQQFPEGIHQVVKIPAILAPDQESVIALLKMGDTVLSLDMNREDISQQFLVVLDRIAPQYSQEVQGQLDKLTIFNRITKQRLEERKRFAGALDIMTQKKEQANNKADALEADLGKEKIELSSEKAEKASVQKELALKSKVLAEVQLDRELLAQITPQTIERYLEHGTPLSPQEYLQREIKPFSILPGETILGRSKDANIVLSDQSVSRVHATFSSINGRVQIVDNGSSNGTYVDGERLTSNSPVEIVDGSVIKFGKSFSEYVFFNQKLILRTKYQNLPKFIF